MEKNKTKQSRLDALSDLSAACLHDSFFFGTIIVFMIVEFGVWEAICLGATYSYRAPKPSSFLSRHYTRLTCEKVCRISLTMNMTRDPGLDGWMDGWKGGWSPYPPAP